MADTDIQVINKGNVEELNGKGDIELYEIKYTSKRGEVYDMVGFHIKKAFKYKNAFIIIANDGNLNAGPGEGKGVPCLWIEFKKKHKAVIEYINKHPICGRSRMPERGTGSMMMDISQYILNMFNIKESSMHDQAFVTIDGIMVSTMSLYTLLTGYSWYAKWGYFSIDPREKQITKKNYDVVHNTIMTKKRLDDIRDNLRDIYNEPIDPSFLKPRRRRRSGPSEADQYYANQKAIDDFMQLSSLKEFYKLEGLPFNEFYKQLLDSHPVVALGNMDVIQPEEVNTGWELEGNYVKYH